MVTVLPNMEVTRILQNPVYLMKGRGRGRGKQGGGGGSRDREPVFQPRLVQ